MDRILQRQEVKPVKGHFGHFKVNSRLYSNVVLTQKLILVLASCQLSHQGLQGSLSEEAQQSHTDLFN